MTEWKSLTYVLESNLSDGAPEGEYVLRAEAEAKLFGYIDENAEFQRMLDREYRKVADLQAKLAAAECNCFNCKDWEMDPCCGECPRIRIASLEAENKRLRAESGADPEGGGE